MEINKINLIEHHNNKNTLDLETASLRLIEFLSKNNLKFTTVIGHNVNFDISFVQEHLLPKDQFHKFFSFNVIDTIVIGQFLKLSGKIPFYQKLSLSALIEYFGKSKDKDSEHTAEYDTEMTIVLLREFLNLVKVKDEPIVKRKKL